MQAGLFAKKVGMTQIFSKTGEAIPVTVVDVSGNTVLRVKNEENDGYNAVQIGLGERKASRTNHPTQKDFEKLGITPKQHINEIRVRKSDLEKFSSSQVMKATDIFVDGEKIDVTGTSKGRGFAGVMKRHNFRGFLRSHGTHEFFRHGGSIGTRLTPGHVLKGKKMPGHMGNKQVTVQNLSIAKIDTDRDLIYVRGGIPGPNRGLVLIRKAVK